MTLQTTDTQMSGYESGLQNRRPQLLFCVSTFVSVTLVDLFEENSEEPPSVFVFYGDLVTFPAVLYYKHIVVTREKQKSEPKQT